MVALVDTLSSFFVLYSRCEYASPGNYSLPKVFGVGLMRVPYPNASFPSPFSTAVQGSITPAGREVSSFARTAATFIASSVSPTSVNARTIVLQRVSGMHFGLSVWETFHAHRLLFGVRGEVVEAAVPVAAAAEDPFGTSSSFSGTLWQLSGSLS